MSRKNSKQIEQFSQFDRFNEETLASWHCPGLATVTIKENQVLHKGAYGLRDIENNVAMTTDTRFAMASITKSFTAMSVALLVDEGKLDWDKPVRDYMPEFILANSYATEHITLRDMLSHRTGLPRHDWSARHVNMSRADFIKQMKHLKFTKTLREAYQYNNLMYLATAHLVEKIAGQRWEDFVKERIFEPLGMKASNFDPQSPVADWPIAEGYRVTRDDQGQATGFKKTKFKPFTDLSPGAAGALFSTLDDLTTWLKVHVNKGSFNEKRLVSKDALKQMHSPQIIRSLDGITEALRGATLATYGMGWFIESYKGEIIVHHGGNLDGFSLMMGFVPTKGIGIISLTNIGHLPVRDIVFNEALDLALNLEKSDWNGKYHNIYDPIFVGRAKAHKTTEEEKLKAAPSHPLEAYTGSYEANGYPDVFIRLKNGSLQASTLEYFDWTTLRHQHYDVFEWH